MGFSFFDHLTVLCSLEFFSDCVAKKLEEKLIF